MSRYHKSYGQAPSTNAYNYKAKPAQQSYGQRSQPAQNQMSSSEQALMKSSFQIFDIDGSGNISSQEFKDTIRCLGYTASDAEIEKLMKTYDYDGNGVMDFDEFLSMVQHMKSEGFNHGRQALEKKIKDAFSVLDVDGDRYLTTRELRYVLCNTGDRFSPAEFESFMRLFDKNNDGRISCQELIEIMGTSLENFVKKLML